MSQNDDWNPADGPPPTDDERADASALDGALASAASSGMKKAAERELESLVAAALRVRATAHPDQDRARAIANSAIEHALQAAQPRWYRSRWRWLAVAAAGLLGIGGIQLALHRFGSGDASAPISHTATDVFTSPIEGDARSVPIGRITDARMRSYRDALLHARTRRSP